MTECVYFLQEHDGGPIKIGTTGVGTRARISGLQTGNPEKLHELVAIPGGEPLEKRLHRQFRRYQVRDRSEWFIPNPELLGLIQGAQLAIGRRPKQRRELAPKEPVHEVAEGSRAALEAIKAIEEAPEMPILPRRKR